MPARGGWEVGFVGEGAGGGGEGGGGRGALTLWRKLGMGILIRQRTGGQTGPWTLRAYRLAPVSRAH